MFRAWCNYNSRPTVYDMQIRGLQHKKNISNFHSLEVICCRREILEMSEYKLYNLACCKGVTISHESTQFYLFYNYILKSTIKVIFIVSKI